MKKWSLVAAAFVSAASSAVMAGELSLPELKKRCGEWEANGQIKKFETTIACSTSYTAWKQAEDGTFSLPTALEYRVRFTMKDGRYETGTMTYRGQIANDTGTCSAYDQYRISVSGPVAHVHSCAELNAITDFAAFCKNVIDAQCADDPALCTENVVATGKHVNTCPQKS